MTPINWQVQSSKRLSKRSWTRKLSNFRILALVTMSWHYNVPNFLILAPVSMLWRHSTAVAFRKKSKQTKSSTRLEGKQGNRIYNKPVGQKFDRLQLQLCLLSCWSEWRSQIQNSYRIQTVRISMCNLRIQHWRSEIVKRTCRKSSCQRSQNRWHRIQVTNLRCICWWLVQSTNHRRHVGAGWWATN